MELKVTTDRIAEAPFAGVRLSSRQREVLIWTAQGKTTWETSIIMKCAEATVNYHLKQVFRKLRVTNKTHAVSRALNLGLIDIDARTVQPTPDTVSDLESVPSEEA